MSTPAVNALTAAGVPFTLHEYEVAEAVGEGYGEAVAAALDTVPERVFKTLMAVVDDRHVVAVVPVAGRLSPKALARAAGGKKASMADAADAERLTGYVSGGISPLGQRRRHPTFVDRTATEFPTVFVSAGKRGLQVELSPGDLVAVTSGEIAPLV
ncbi:MAG: Cys-tRNA(Pro) deacylase [Actinomycetota bacterium]